MKLKGFKFLALALATALTLTACGGGGGTSDSGGGEKKADNNTPAATDVATPQVNRIVSSNMAEPGTLDPAKARGTHESWPLNHLFAGLTRTNKDGKVENVLADKIEVSEDGKVYKVTLKDGLKWSDGNPVTAEDFEFSWKRVLDPKMESQLHTNYTI